MRFVVEGPRESAPVDTSLVRLLLRAQKIGNRLFEARAALRSDTAGYQEELLRYCARPKTLDSA